jgi:predicted secreted protein
MIRYLIPFIITTLILTACQNPTTNSNGNPNTQTFIHANVGEIIQIEIVNGSADGGYWWNVTTDFDSTKAKLLSFKTEYTGAPGVDGAPVKEIWLYQALKSGITILEIKLYRGSEPDSISSSKSYYLTIQ